MQIFVYLLFINKQIMYYLLEFLKIQHHRINLLCKNLKKYNSTSKNQMIADEQRTSTLLQPLIKIIKDRQDLYFEALSFAKKNFQSSSNDIDQISVFNKFLAQAAEADNQLVARQTMLLSKVGPGEDPPSEGYKVPNTSKQMMRLFGRVLQKLDISYQKARGTIFNENGKLGIDFSRFKKNLHKSIQNQSIDLVDFSGLIVNYVKNKYRRQINRVKNYLNRLQAGEHISLKDMFVKDGSDASVSPDEKHNKTVKSIKPNRKLLKQQRPESESPIKKLSTKKVSQVSNKKRTLNLKTARKQQYQSDTMQDAKQKKISKSATANLLLKFYSVMELNNKKFLQDYVFQAHQQQKHKKRLMTQLLEKNNKNSQMITEYYSKCENFNFNNHNLNKHSGSDQNQSVPRNDSSLISKISSRTSFIISKRKGSFVYETGSDRSDIQFYENTKLPSSKTIKNISPTRKSQEKKSSHIRPKPSNHSKKIFVIKQPLNFDDEVIPKVEMSNVSWIQPSLTGKDRSRKNEHIRLKKRNNPVPLDEKYLPQSFRLSHYPI